MITNIAELGKPIDVQHRRVEGIIKNHAIYADGSTCDEYYDTLTEEYEIIFRDTNGIIIRYEFYNKFGDYEILQAEIYDNSNREKGTTVFTKKISDTDLYNSMKGDF